MDKYIFDWADLAFQSKKPLASLGATFISAPRTISGARFTQLVKELLPKSSIILGIAKEEFIDGFSGQPQFKTLQYTDIQSIVEKVADSSSPNKIYVLSYFQRELVTIVEKLSPKMMIFVNGSWRYSFHTLPIYYTLTSNHIPYQLVSPFVDEDEARAYEKQITSKSQPGIDSKKMYSEKQLIDMTDEVAKSSFDYGFQTGAILAKETNKGYRILLTGYNKVVPYQTYAMHHGALRETHFSPSNDLNYYDTIHAEMAILVEAQKQKIDLANTTLFVNLMPCPTCARTLSVSDISEYIYRLDHSGGYALDLLQNSGRNVRGSV